MKKLYFNELAIKNIDDFLYARSLKPVILKNGLTIGGGTLYPELNFTLPPMIIEESTVSEAVSIYKEIMTGVCKRAKELYAEGFVTEIELLPPMTFHPEWGIEVCKTVSGILKEFEAESGIMTALRITPVDIREGRDLSHMWRGKHWENIMRTFEGCAEAGADFLAIESVGGKEVHDEAVMYCDIGKSLFALSILGCTDMEKLWTQIVSIAQKTGSIPSGDTACGFANTAMVLADRNYIPKVFAAVVRVMSAVRSLTALECGAKGPHKDCGYEGVYVKAITGTPIAMEGRTSACAHLSPVGNIAACVADLWSNESVQNIKLLGGMAPVVSLEQLIYDCRLLNKASEKSREAALLMRDLHADSDSCFDPQAYVLRPDVVLDISREIVKHEDSYARTRAAALLTTQTLRKAHAEGKLLLNEKELSWLDNISGELDALPEDRGEFTKSIIGECEKLDPAKYDM